MRRTLVVIVALSLLGAGCIGSSGDPADEEAGPTSVPHGNESGEDSGNETNGTEGNGTANDTNESEDDGAFGDGTREEGNETDEEPRWTYENRTGTVEGNNALVTHASETESFTVAEGAEELQLNLTAEGGELDVCIRSASASNGSGNASGDQSPCTAEESTQDGNLTWSTQTPEPGEWSIEMTAQGVGPQSVEYELVVAQRAPAEAASGSGT